MANAREMFLYRKLTTEELAAFEKKGYCFYGPILSKPGLAEMLGQCQAAWTAYKGEFDPSKTWLENALLANIHHRAPLVRDFYFEGPLVDVAEQIIGPNIKGATSQLTFKVKGNTRTFGWHQDNGYGELDPYNALSCLVALDDTDEENGCLWLVPGSNEGGQLRPEQLLQTKSKTELDAAVDESEAIPMPLKKGECLILHCWTLHKSKGNFSQRDRRILFLRYADADAVEVRNSRKPRVGRLLRGTTRFEEVRTYEADL